MAFQTVQARVAADIAQIRGHIFAVNGLGVGDDHQQVLRVSLGAKIASGLKLCKDGVKLLLGKGVIARIVVQIVIVVGGISQLKQKIFFAHDHAALICNAKQMVLIFTDKA